MLTAANSTHNFSEREQQILDATLALVAEYGLLKTSLSKISQRAKCSPGIVYHYFNSKDEILETLFMSIFGEMMAHVLDESVLALPIAERYKQLWLRKYRYHYNNPDKTIYIEQYKNSSYYSAEREQASQLMMSGLMTMGHNDISQGLVLNLPLDVIYTMTMTVALNLAKGHVQSGVELNEDTLNTIAERCVGSILT